MSAVTRFRTASDGAISALGDGLTVDLLKVTETRDPISGTVNESVTSHSILAKLLQFRADEEFFTNVQANDQKLYLSATQLAAAGVEPEANDRVRIGSSTYSIVAIKKYSPGNTPVFWSVQVRN